ncbi:MAG: hypothetical protein JNJ85_13010 [Candidatus Kapabacteria bacterium]|nr:hypothetical protein [Candidatus Kapabacteria bacterium]MBX7155772.1 hypothetical protein [Bacteroidota bacterium]
MKTKIIIPLLLLLAVTGCTIVNYPNRNAQQQQTQLQTRQYQQREFDTNDVKLIMKAVLNTLQDDGFIVKNAVVDLGLLSATKEISLKGSSQGTTQNSNDDFWTIIFRDAIAGRRGAATPRNEPVRYQNLKQIEATINVSEFGKQTRVRASFQARILDNEGNVMESYPIDDMKFYQDFFVKVDKGVFIQKQKF